MSLSDGSKLDADLVIAAVGVTPNTQFAKGLALDRDGGLNADVFLRSTSNKDVFGAGDLVSYPYFYSKERVREEHLTNAVNQGANAAWNMLGKMVPYEGVPFYWSRQHNKSIGVTGKTNGFDEVVIDGKPEDFEFAAYYFRDGKMIAASGMNRAKDLILINQALRQHVKLTKEHLDGTALNKDKLSKILDSPKKGCGCHRAGNNDAPCRP